VYQDFWSEIFYENDYVYPLRSSVHVGLRIELLILVMIYLKGEHFVAFHPEQGHIPTTCADHDSSSPKE